MPAKHRCNCFSSESSSFLYDLRRETPSTDRVLKERLLNVLSRAAANKTGNPQRLWAPNERPEWWAEVTDLKWKNPREHPKDNKETLNQKIEILEEQLRKRGLMTKEVEDELRANKEGKRFDLELKSDFEAVIAKASGLHFMVNKVKDKMGSTRVMSDRLANYIRSIKTCMEKCLQNVCVMNQQVEDREKQKSQLWKKMGVSREGAIDEAIKRTWAESDVLFDSDELMLDDEDIPDTTVLKSHQHRAYSLFTHFPPSDILHRHSSSFYPFSSPSPDSPPLDPEFVAVHKMPELPLFRKSDKPVTKASRSEGDSPRVKNTFAPIHPIFASSAKKSRRQSTDDNVELDEVEIFSERVLSPTTASRQTLWQTFKQSVQPMRHKHKGRPPELSTCKEAAASETAQSAARNNPPTFLFLPSDVEVDGVECPDSRSNPCSPIVDVETLNAGKVQLDLDNVTDIFEDRGDMELSMGVLAETDVKVMDSLADQTKALSCDDLSPSVMEDVSLQLAPRLPFVRSMSEHTRVSPPSARFVSVPPSFLLDEAPTVQAVAETSHNTSRGGQRRSLSQAIGNCLN